MQEIGKIAEKHKHKNKNREERQMDINVIPNNMEKYMAFMLGNHLTFIDSFQFMSSSLDKLVSNLPDEAFKYTSEGITNDKKLNLLKRKGTLMTTWIVSENLMKINYQIKTIFIVH